MRKFTKLVIAFAAIMIAQVAINAQNTGSIAGTVMDPNGAVVPGATVKVKGAAGQEFSTVTSAGGTYRVPAVQSGLYTVTISATSKTNASSPAPASMPPTGTRRGNCMGISCARIMRMPRSFR